MKSVAVITARGGSKRIPRKNIKPFLGKPILEYSIEAALQADLFHEVMVSTDDEEIAEVAKRAGAKVPFFRSAKSPFLEFVCNYVMSLFPFLSPVPPIHLLFSFKLLTSYSIECFHSYFEV